MLFIEPKSFDAAFHFATEEFCMNHFPQDTTIWMLWRTKKCIMLGSNQIPGLEIDMQAADKHGVQIVRRPSGGGTIFTDPGTIQYTVIMPFKQEMDVKQVERKVLAAAMLRVINGSLGLPAKLEGRNDITLAGRKISGLAQHIQNGRLCSHGSLLYDTDLDILTEVLNPGDDKIKSKSIRSVRSRVTSLKSHLPAPMEIDDFFDYLKQDWMTYHNMEEYVLAEADIAAINKIRLEKYANNDWTYGKTPKFTYHNRVKYDMGIVEVFLTIEKGMIRDCSINGDFLSVLPITKLQETITGLAYQREVIDAALTKINVSPYLGGITHEQLLNTLF